MTRPHLHSHFNFTGSMLKTVAMSFYLSCGSELARQGTSLKIFNFRLKFGLYLVSLCEILTYSLWGFWKCCFVALIQRALVLFISSVVWLNTMLVKKISFFKRALLYWWADSINSQRPLSISLLQKATNAKMFAHTPPPIFPADYSITTIVTLKKYVIINELPSI